MGQSNGKQQPRYSLSSTGVAEKELEGILEAATAAGSQDVVISAMTAIMTRLRSAPDHFGEPLYHIPSLKMTVRCLAIIPLYIEYGLHDEQPVVIIRRVAAL